MRLFGIKLLKNKDYENLEKELQDLKKRKKLPPLEHNSLLDIVYQIEAFKHDLKTIIQTCNARVDIVNNRSNVIAKTYNIENYTEDLRSNKDIAALKTKY
eukprot:Anaeramoba_ignava/a363516_8.p1 GENE.a363516_8~~a363516_8.p1  ORF type:complete len:100 (-),score=13.80 a363516_8:165-464(-)